MNRAIFVIAVLLAVPSCTQRDSVAALPALGREVASPSIDQAERIRVAVAVWSSDRFLALAPRWFVLAPGTPAVAVLKQVDNSLGGEAQRIAESGPAGDVTLYGWRLDGAHGVVAAVTVEHGAAPLAAYFPIRIDHRWRAGRR